MKDLKYIYEFENLLQEANNDLVKQAKNDGGIALGYTCYHIPEVLLNCGNCFSVRLRAPRTGSMDIATYYMSNFLCGYSKAILERAIEGGYNFLNALLASETCSEMNRAAEHFELLNLVATENIKQHLTRETVCCCLQKIRTHTPFTTSTGRSATTLRHNLNNLSYDFHISFIFLHKVSTISVYGQKNGVAF